MVRGGRQKKVRLDLAPYCQGRSPRTSPGTSPSFTTSANSLPRPTRSVPAFAGMDALFDTAGADPALTEAIIAWAGQTEAAIKEFGARAGNAPEIFDHTVFLLSAAPIFPPRAASRKGRSKHLEETLNATYMAATLLAACINLACPDQLTDLQPGWIDDLLEATRSLDRQHRPGAAVDPMARRRGRRARPRNRTAHHRDRSRRSRRPPDPARL